MQDYNTPVDDSLSRTTKIQTIVYNQEGKEIKRYDGIKELYGRDFKDTLPINYKVVKTTVEILSSVTIDKKL